MVLFNFFMVLAIGLAVNNEKAVNKVESLDDLKAAIVSTVPETANHDRYND
jgi:hypothetical protein